jgi:hypothetical protein
VEVLDKAGSADAGIEAPLICVIGPTTAARRAEGGVTHQRFSEKTDQFIGIDGIHCADDANNGDGTVKCCWGTAP